VNRAREPAVRRFVADYAFQVVGAAAGGVLPGRAIAEHVNEEFERQPSTRNIVVARRELDAVLERDGRFERVDESWKVRGLAAGPPTDTVALRLSPLRPGVSLSLHAWQRGALAAWQRADRRGIIEAVTGSGKTRIGLAAIVEHLVTPAARAAVIVPTIELMEQWVGQLHRLLAVPVGSVGGGSREQFADHAVLVYVARSAADMLPRDAAGARSQNLLLVADECHRYGANCIHAQSRRPSWRRLGFPQRLSVSTTPALQNTSFQALAP